MLAAPRCAQSGGRRDRPDPDPAEDGTYFFDGVMPGRYTLHYLLGEHREMAKVVEGGKHRGPRRARDTVYGPFEVVMARPSPCPWRAR